VRPASSVWPIPASVEAWPMSRAVIKLIRTARERIVFRFAAYVCWHFVESVLPAVAGYKIYVYRAIYRSDPIFPLQLDQHGAYPIPIYLSFDYEIMWERWHFFVANATIARGTSRLKNRKYQLVVTRLKRQACNRVLKCRNESISTVSWPCNYRRANMDWFTDNSALRR